MKARLTSLVIQAYCVLLAGVYFSQSVRLVGVRVWGIREYRGRVTIWTGRRLHWSWAVVRVRWMRRRRGSKENILAVGD